jgi:protein CpxP
MKNNKKWLTTAAVLALSSTLAFAAPHEGGRHGRGGRRGEFSERFAEKLNLTDAQKQQIKDIQTNFREQNKAFFESTRETRKQMHDAKEAGDTARFESLKATAQGQREQMKQLREAQMQRVTSVLTPAQKSQWDALKAERQAKRDQRGEHRNHE